MRVCMFVYNRCTTDARVLKEARSLADAGHSVRIVAVLDQTTAPREQREGAEIVRIERNPIHYRLLRGLRQFRMGIRRSFRLVRRARRLVRVLALASRARYAPRTEAPRADPVAPSSPPPGRQLVRRLDLRLYTGARRVLLVPHKPLMFVDYYRQGLRLARDEPADVYHAHDLNTLPVAWLAARRTGGKLVYDAHELYHEISTLSERERKIWRFVERRLIPSADGVITVCESIADELARRYPVAPAPLVVLNCPQRNGASLQHSDLLRERLRLSSEPIVLYQGGFTVNRGLEVLVRAASEVPDVSVVLMGWGPLEDALRKSIHDAGLGARVIITPPVPAEEVVAYAAGADVGVIPYEPVGLNNTFTTPNKLFDYMNAGLPVVASRLPELERFVDGLGIGMTFEAGNAGALASAIGAVLEASANQRMRAAARSAAPRFTWGNEGQKLVDLYETFANSGRTVGTLDG